MATVSKNRVSIELSKAQINRVIREAAHDTSLADSGILTQLDFDAFNSRLDDVRFSRSLLRGLMVLASFPADGSDRAVTDVAKQLGMGVSTTHRYASTFVEVGLLERDPVSRRYRRAGTG
ncbi:MAG: helix-turn-helix domain-containing protein [Solirubrobacteraceae bacterium]